MPQEGKGGASPSRRAAMAEASRNSQSSAPVVARRDELAPLSRRSRAVLVPRCIQRAAFIIFLQAITSGPIQARDAAPRELRVRIAGHVFDHLGSIGDQAAAAAASGANIIYVSGLGALGYQ